MTQDILKRALSDADAHRIVAPRADQVTNVLSTSANGRVKVYGEANSSPHTSARRTEVEIDEGKWVIILKDTGSMAGDFAAASRFQKVTVKNGPNESVLTLRDEGSSPFNPLYVFRDGETKIGSGYGSMIDLRIAGDLLHENVPHGGTFIQNEVIDWIKSKLI